MKHGSLTPLPRFARSLPCIGGIAAAALLLASSPPATAGIFGASKNDVAVRVAELPNSDSRIYPLGLDFSPDGRHLAVESQSGKIYIWDWRGKRVERTLELPDGGNALGATNPIRFSIDGRFLAACEVSGAGDVVVRIWDAASGLIVRDVERGPAVDRPGGCTGIGFTPDGGEMLSTSERNGTPGNTLISYAVKTWQPLWGLQMDGLSPKSLAISPDGDLAAVAGTIFVMPQGVKNPIERFQQAKTECKVNIVDLKRREVVKVIDVQSRSMGPVAWSPDGARLAIVGGAVEILDSKSGKSLAIDTMETVGSENVRFTPDGRYLIVSDLNGRGKGLGLKIWDGEHQQLLQHLSIGDVGAIAVSRDGKYLAVGETGRTTIWQFKRTS